MIVTVIVVLAVLVILAVLAAERAPGTADEPGRAVP